MYSPGPEILLAADLVGIGNGLLSDITSVLITAGSAIGILYVLKQWMDSGFTLVRLLLAIFCAGVAIYAINNLSDFGSATKETVDKHKSMSDTSIVLVIDDQV